MNCYYESHENFRLFNELVLEKTKRKKPYSNSRRVHMYV